MSGIFDAISAALNQAMQQQNASAPPMQPQMQEPPPEQVQTGRPATPPGGGQPSFSDLLEKSGFGSLSGLVKQLSVGGLDKQVQSWLGSGENMPVQPGQLRDALGNQRVQNMGQQAGIPVEGILKILAMYLPSAIDQASPNGKLQDPKSTH
jgi:uncharacterized protein YidB (DUF937 family)